MADPEGSPMKQIRRQMTVPASLDSANPIHARGGHLFNAALFGGGLTGISYLALNWPPWAQAVITLLGMIAFVGLWRLKFSGRLSFADPGIFFMFVICVYTAIPMLTFEYYDYTFGPKTDTRLYHIVLDQGLVADVWLCSSLAMAGFGAAYLALRAPRMGALPKTMPKGAIGALWVGLAIAVIINIIAFLGRGGSGDYADEYLFFRTLPVWVVQVINILSMMFQVSVFGLFAYYLAAKRMLVAWSLLIASLAFFAVTTDSRSLLVIVAGGFFILRDHLIKRFSPTMLAVLAVLGLATFLALGFIREGELAISDIAGRNEFVAVFVTALDVQQLYITGSTLDMNTSLLVGDLVRLIPQQLLGFEKIDPATWYVANFYPYYAESGGGLAFGMVSESVLGGGGFVALVRGLALGGLIASSINFLSRRASIWRLIVYVWLFINVYQSFRDTTFSLVGRFAFQFAPGLLLVILLSQLLALRVSAPGRPAIGKGKAGPA